jgi:Protein of unknown function (DUF3431)
MADGFSGITTISSMVITRSPVSPSFTTDTNAVDGVPMMQNLQIPYVQSQGYVNLRCVWTLGCPAELHFEANKTQPHWLFRQHEIQFPSVWSKLFPDTELPQIIGQPCCAQFAVTREVVKSRALADYKRYRDWLIETDMYDINSGRVFEYIWHSK